MEAIFTSEINVRNVSCKKDPAAHVEEMHDVTTKKKITKKSVFTQTFLPVKNSLIRMDTSTKTYNQ